MNSSILAKLKIVLLLLVAASLLQSIAFFAFVNVDTTLVNSILYEYGLQFDVSWYNLYQDQLGMFLISLFVSTSLLVVSVAVVVRFIIRNQGSLTIAEYVVPASVVFLNIFSIYGLSGILDTIQSDFYSFGLQYSIEWASPLLEYVLVLITIIVLSSSMVIATSFCSP